MGSEQDGASEAGSFGATFLSLSGGDDALIEAASELVERPKGQKSSPLQILPKGINPRIRGLCSAVGASALTPHTRVRQSYVQRSLPFRLSSRRPAAPAKILADCLL